MSGGLKRVAQLDSQNLKHLGQDWNLPWLEAEASHNEKNPGRAMTKAAANAALWWLMAPADAAAEAGTAAAATDVAESGGTMALNAAGQAAPYVEYAAQVQPFLQAMENPSLYEQVTSGVKDAVVQGKNSIKSGINSLKDGVNSIPYRALPGVGTEPVTAAGESQASLLAKQTGDFGAYGLGKTMEAAASNPNLGAAQQALGNYGGKALGLLGGGGGGKTMDAMKAMQMLNAMQPQQQPQGPMAPPPRQQADMSPLASPYANPYGEGGNSIAMGLLSEKEKKKRLKQMGLLGGYE